MTFVRISEIGKSRGEADEGFARPFEMLAACHERVHRMLRLLEKLRAHLRDHGADLQAQQAARDVMRYFDQAAPQHHLDEERHVFPPLLAAGDGRVVAVVRRLQADHGRMEAAWAALRPVLARVAGGEAPGPQGEGPFEAFAGLYAEHIVAEEEIAYPAARLALDGPALEAMRQDMMQRRGL